MKTHLSDTASIGVSSVIRQDQNYCQNVTKQPVFDTATRYSSLRSHSKFCKHIKQNFTKHLMASLSMRDKMENAKRMLLEHKEETEFKWYLYILYNAVYSV
jgi:hypothetical protein